MYFPIQAYVKLHTPKWSHFCADFFSMRKLNKAYLKDAAYKMFLYLDYLFMRRRAFNVFPSIFLCEMKHSLVGPILGGIFFFKGKLYKPFPKDTVYQISEYMECQIVKFFKTNQILPLFGPKYVPPP